MKANNIVALGEEPRKIIRERLMKVLSQQTGTDNTRYVDAYILGTLELTPGKFAAILLTEHTTEEGKVYAVPVRLDLSFAIFGDNEEIL